jgi:hypothetical protein
MKKFIKELVGVSRFEVNRAELQRYATPLTEKKDKFMEHKNSLHPI